MKNRRLTLEDRIKKKYQKWFSGEEYKIWLHTEVVWQEEMVLRWLGTEVVTYKNSNKRSRVVFETGPNRMYKDRKNDEEMEN